MQKRRRAGWRREGVKGKAERKNNKGDGKMRDWKLTWIEPRNVLSSSGGMGNLLVRYHLYWRLTSVVGRSVVVYAVGVVIRGPQGVAQLIKGCFWGRAAGDVTA